ncbi:glycosyltransferase family 2 protein [Alteromonas macleodii]|uniref:glycosyltransferase family 2 protein n=1 Tax=Alteromonas macleodii TaxID=28108 RepID=UPI003CFCA673
MKISVLVVLYNKRIGQSETLKSLSKLETNTFSLHIFNNGPKSLSNNEEEDVLLNKFEKLNIKEDIQNRPLSKIYNDFIEENESDTFLILDDDSKISKEIIEISKNTNFDIDISLPIIISEDDKKNYYPIIDGSTIESEETLEYKPGFFSIGSGLLIHKKLKSKFKQYSMKIFDERFALYGVDFSIFRRMNYLYNDGERFKINISGKILHSLSKVNENRDLMRNDERFIAIFLANIIYRKSALKSYIFIVRQILSNIIKLDRKRVSLVFFLLANRSHPRSIGYISHKEPKVLSLK